MFIAILTLGLLAAIFGLILGYASVRFHVDADPIADRIDSLLPQTQCGQCGHPGCRPYAESIAAGQDDINKCKPGGEATIIAMADLLGVDPKPMDGGDEEEPEGKLVAWVDEQTCIGCTLCLQACPVDAILGAAKQMHTIIKNECTGCKLCIEPCPVECIHMLPVVETVQTWKWPFPSELPKELNG